MRWFMTFGAIAILALVGGPALADTLYEFPVGTWSAGAYSKQSSRQFNHCAAAANYNSGITMLFSVSRSYAWSMSFANRAWRLTQGQTYDIAFTVDQTSPIGARAIAIGPNQVEVPLADSTELFQRFRQGYQLRVAAAGQVFAFNLTGTSQVLPALLRCVQANLQPAGTTTVAANPFAAPTPATRQPSNAAGQGRPAAYRAEALSLAANILGSAGIVGFQIAEGDNGIVDAAWRADRLFGMVRIEPKDPPALISAGMIAVDAAGCKSKFASGSIPASDSNDVPRMFTKCGDGDQGYTVFYFILPRKAGGHYLIGTGTSGGGEEPARQVESDIRQATLKVMGR